MTAKILAIRPVEGGLEEAAGSLGEKEVAIEGEARKVKRTLNPILPSAEEVAEHNLTHLPFLEIGAHIASEAEARR